MLGKQKIDDSAAVLAVPAVDTPMRSAEQIKAASEREQALLRNRQQMQAEIASNEMRAARADEEMKELKDEVADKAKQEVRDIRAK